MNFRGATAAGFSAGVASFVIVISGMFMDVGEKRIKLEMRIQGPCGGASGLLCAVTG